MMNRYYASTDVCVRRRLAACCGAAVPVAAARVATLDHRVAERGQLPMRPVSAMPMPGP